MCRLAAYLGSPISLDAFLLQPEHSLVNQAWQPRELKEAKLNADGFGIGWYNENNQAATYKQTQPIWSDPNLTALSKSLTRNRWLANVRSATLIGDVSYANTQPFVGDKILFTHNGYLENFGDHWRGNIRKILIPEYEKDIHGTSDSEYIFALLRQFTNEQGDIVSGISSLIEFLDTHSNGSRALVNLLVSTPTQLIALRHAINGQCPSLYYHKEENGSGNAIRIASESLTSDESWKSIEENRMLVIDNNLVIEPRRL